MKFRTHFLLLSSASALFLSTFALDAAASSGWDRLGLMSTAQQAVSIFGSVYVLAGTRTSGGYHLKTPQYGGYPLQIVGWNDYGSAVGTSITGSQNGNLWLVDGNSDVWNTKNGWSVYPSNNCDGGGHVTINQPAQDNPHNTVAVGRDSYGNDHVYVVSDGTTRWWNGACWYRMPNLPSGTAMEVAIDIKHPYSGAPQLPWVVNTVGTMFRWTGSSWITITTGIAKGLNSQAEVIGSDGSSRWGYDGTNFTYLDSLNPGGAIRSLGTAMPVYGDSEQVSEILVDTYGEVLVKFDKSW